MNSPSGIRIYGLGLCPDTDTVLNEEVETYITNTPIDLNTATTIGGYDILTTPTTIHTISCNQGEVLSYDAGSWTCRFSNLARQ